MIDNKLKETDLCQPVIDYFIKSEGKDIEVFHEVKSSGSKKIDLVIKKDGKVIAIELKLHANLSLIKQAFYNIQYSNFSYIALPLKSKRAAGERFMKNMCESLGIGILYVGWQYCHPEDKTICEMVLADEHSPIRKLSLFENQKTFVKAGEASGSCWSEYKETLMNVENYIKENGSETIINILRKINHHYSSAKVGSGVLIRYIRDGTIKNLTIDEKYKVSMKKKETD